MRHWSSGASHEAQIVGKEAQRSDDQFEGRRIFSVKEAKHNKIVTTCQECTDRNAVDKRRGGCGSCHDELCVVGAISDPTYPSEPE